MLKFCKSGMISRKFQTKKYKLGLFFSIKQNYSVNVFNQRFRTTVWN